MIKDIQNLFTGLIFFAVLTLISCTAPCATAQELSSAGVSKDVTPAAASPAPSDSEHQKWDVYGGYSFMRFSNSDNMNGFETAVTRNVTRYFGLKFDFSGNYYSHTAGNSNLTTIVKRNVYNYLGGVQIKDNSTKKRFKPFAHVLVGVHTFRYSFDASGSAVKCVVDCHSEGRLTGLSLTAGGGIDIRITRHIDVRAIQIDYNGANTEGWGNNFRIGAGVVFHL